MELADTTWKHQKLAENTWKNYLDLVVNGHAFNKEVVGREIGQTFYSSYWILSIYSISFSNGF